MCVHYVVCFKYILVNYISIRQKKFNWGTIYEIIHTHTETHKIGWITKMKEILSELKRVFLRGSQVFCGPKLLCNLPPKQHGVSEFRHRKIQGTLDTYNLD